MQTKDEFIKLRISKDGHKKLKSEAKKRKTTISEMIRSGLEMVFDLFI